MRHTHSLCPVCYTTVPAVVDGTVMYYTCPDHGEFSGVVEKDADFLARVGYGRSSDIFKALTINITNECNDRCPLCYYPCGEGHMEVEEVLRTIDRFPDFNIWLGGGEPTLHPDLFRIMEHPRVTATLTNGIALADKEFMTRFVASGLDPQGYVRAVISLQPSNLGKKLQALENAREMGVTFNCGMFSITSADEVEAIMQFWGEWEDVLLHARIRTPFCSWNQEAPKTLYLSDVYHALQECVPHFEMTEDMGGNSIYSTIYKNNGRYLFTCCAPHYTTFDVDAVQAAPHQLALDGNAYPTPLALVVNQGIMKGSL